MWVQRAEPFPDRMSRRPLSGSGGKDYRKILGVCSALLLTPYKIRMMRCRTGVLRRQSRRTGHDENISALENGEQIH